jgi:YHYH protein
MISKLNLSKASQKTGLALGLLLTSAAILVACGGGSSSSSTSDPNAVTTLVTSVNGASNTVCGRNVQCINAPLAYQGTDITALLAQPMGQVSGTNSPWTDPTTNIMTLSKILYVSGLNSATKYSSQGSQFAMTTDTAYTITGFPNAGARIFLGNGLPSTLMGNFPVQPGDPAYSYYAALPGGTNPDTGQVYSSAAAIGISPYALQSYIPLTPVASPVGSPNTIQSLIVGITLTGAVWHFEKAPNNANVLFNPTNALPTDQCFGHPYYEQYHYHGYSWKCFPNQGSSGQSPVFGFALDGYPITGPRAADGHMLTNAELDECHGTTSTITMPDGSSKNTYHYVLNNQYPYSVGCFRGKVNYVQALGQGLSNNLMKEGLTYTDSAVGN